MATIPSADSFPEPVDNSHPAIAQRRWEVQQERLMDGLFQDAPTVDDLVGPERWNALT